MPHILENVLTRATTLHKPHFNQRSAQKVRGFQSYGSLNLGNFDTPNLRILRQNDIWVLTMWLGIKNTMWGKVVVSPQVRAMVSLVNLCLLVVRSCTKSVPTMH